MGSQRFPGKSLYRFQDKPALQHLVESVQCAVNSSVIRIATSNDAQNRAIINYGHEHGIKIHIGDETNVASRFYDILTEEDCDYFVRLSGDSPLFDYRILKEGLQLLEGLDTGPDLITTKSKNPFPSGMNLEIVKRSTFIEHYKRFDINKHTEHVTTYFYENENIFNIEYLECSIPYPDSCKFSFDTAEDGKSIEGMFEMMDQPHHHYTLKEKCFFYTLVEQNEN